MDRAPSHAAAGKSFTLINSQAGLQHKEAGGKLFFHSVDAVRTNLGGGNFGPTRPGTFCLLSTLTANFLNSTQLAHRMRECHGIWKAGRNRGGICLECSKLRNEEG